MCEPSDRCSISIHKSLPNRINTFHRRFTPPQPQLLSSNLIYNFICQQPIYWKQVQMLKNQKNLLIIYNMDIERHSKQKSKRRTKKQGQKGQFTCKCGRTYFTYAGKYTHIQIKHSGDEEFFEDNNRPERQRLKRGRPIEKCLVISSDAYLHNIVQEALLKIFQSLKKNTDENLKIVLKGKQKLRFSEVQKQYSQLVLEIGQPGFINIYRSRQYSGQSFGKTGKIILDFLENMNQHFIPEIASKITWTINYMLGSCCGYTPIRQENENHLELEIYFQKVRSLKENARIIDVWNGKGDVAEYIFQAFEKWIQAVEKKNALS